MSEIEMKWPSGDFDAVALSTINGDLEIVGTDGAEIRLEGEVESPFARGLDPRVAGRWLRLQAPAPSGEAHLRLLLPRDKAWGLDVSALRGTVQIQGIQGRLKVMLAKGDVEVADSQGVFTVSSAKGDVRLQRCQEREVPAWPKQGVHAEPAKETAGAREEEEEEDEGPRRHLRRHARRWGLDVGRAWEEFLPDEFPNMVPDIVVNLRHMFHSWEPELENAGLNIQSANGDTEFDHVEAQSCMIRLLHGDVQLHHGKIAQLQIQLAKGDIALEDVAVQGNWDIHTTNGDIQVELLPETQARLDVATRHGDLVSAVPLVRVNRPGPGSRHGGRMVGTVGSPGSNPFDVQLSTVHGDIQINWERGERMPETEPARTGRQPQPPSVPVPPAPAERAPIPPVPPQPPLASDEAPARPTPPPAAPAERPADARLAILQSLSRGEISIEEAGHLLDALQ